MQPESAEETSYKNVKKKILAFLNSTVNNEIISLVKNTVELVSHYYQAVGALNK